MLKPFPMSNEIKRQPKEEIVAYPYHTIKYCLEMLRPVEEHGGAMRYLSKKEIGVMTGLSDATLNTRLSACGYYDLLSYRSGDGYKLTDLYQQITAPVFEKDKRSGLLTSFKKPELFSQIIDDLNGKALPSMEGMINHLKGKYRMIPTSAERAVRCFLDNANYLELIDGNNRFKFLLPVSFNDTKLDRQVEKHEAVSKSTTIQEQQNSKVPESDDLFTYPIPLTDGKIAILKFDSKRITKQDIRVLELAIHVLDATIPEKSIPIENESK